MRPHTLAPALAALVLTTVVLSGCSLAGDVTPPPGLISVDGSVAPRAVAPQAEVGPVSAAQVPAAPPSIVQGAAVYAAHCAACHGPTGRGDGEKSDELRAQLSEPIPDFSTPDRLDPRTPGELYQTVTAGRLDRLMPPFANSLSDAERWNAVAFLYTLSATDAEAERGGVMFEAQCAECHASGEPSADPQAADFTDQAYMAGLSQAALIAALAEHEPPLETTVSGADARVVSAFTRRLSFSMEPASPAAIGATGEVGVVRGRVSQGTQAASLPAGLSVVLRGYDDFSQAVMLTTTIATDGAFDFAAVPDAAGRQYMLTVDHAGLAYGSDIFNFENGREVSGLALTVYESTPDTAALRIERLHIAVAEAAGADPFTFSQLMLFGNQGDRTIAPPDGVEVPLPQGATAVAVQGLIEGSDYTRTPEGLRLLVPIRPGPSAAQITVTFQLAGGSAVDYSQRIAYPLGGIDIAVAESLTVSRDGLQDRGTEVLQGATVHAYSAGDLAAGDTLLFQLAAPAVGAGFGLTGIDFGLAGALALALIVLVIGGGYGWWRRRSTGVADVHERDGDIDGLVQAIADLDDAFADGALSERAYREQRASLKARLVTLAGPAPALPRH